ncbi:MAG: DUF4169 family protein [Alphaproteobacteria bacterium]|nr:DUF4169 family protein [Alphaproteobacteria bacterium]
MADIVNLKRTRKQRVRARKEAEAAANRRQFGRPKAERLETERERERAERAQDGARLDRSDDADPPGA